MALTASQREFLVYWAYVLASELGVKAPTCDTLCELMDFGDGGPVVSTTVNVTARLERKGLIRVRRYQREREVQVVSTGRSTAPARCTTPHWRERVA